MFSWTSSHFFPLRENANLETDFFFVRLLLLTMTNPNQLCNVLLFVCSKMTDETDLSSKLPVADRTKERSGDLRKKALLVMP